MDRMNKAPDWQSQTVRMTRQCSQPSRDHSWARLRRWWATINAVSVRNSGAQQVNAGDGAKRAEERGKRK